MNGLLTTPRISNSLVLKINTHVLIYLLSVNALLRPLELINYYNYYLQSLQAIQRITDTRSEVGQLGFETLKFLNSDVVLDGGFGSGYGVGASNASIFGSSCPTNTMYFLNTKYIHYRPHIKRNMVVDERERVSVNQDAEARLILFAGNLTMSNASLQGVLFA